MITRRGVSVTCLFVPPIAGAQSLVAFRAARLRFQSLVVEGRWPDEIIQATDILFASHWRCALTTTEQVRYQKVAVRILLPETAVSMLVANLAEFRR